MTVGIRTPGHDGRKGGSTSARQGPSIVSVRMTAELRCSAEGLATERGESLSELIRGLVYDACKQVSGEPGAAPSNGQPNAAAKQARCGDCRHFDSGTGNCAVHSYVTRAGYPECEAGFEARGEPEGGD